MSDGAKRSSSSTFHLLAGTTSGFSSAILLQPFDLLKTRVQQSAHHASTRFSPSGQRLHTLTPQSLPILTALKNIWSEPQPIKQLWRGTLPSVIRTSVGSGLYFASLERLRRMAAVAEAKTFSQGSKMLDRPLSTVKRTSALPTLSVTANLATGALARASVGFVMMPITVLKVRFESNIYTNSTLPAAGTVPNRMNGTMQKNPYAGLITATREIARSEGLRGFFKGAGATAARDAPYAGIYVGFYEASKSVLSPAVTPWNAARDASSSTSALVNFSSGALAATLATTVTNPPDVVKTRLQLMPEKYTNTFQTVRLLIKEEGLASLWGGLGLRVGRKALSSALAWTVYEEAVRRATAIWTTENSS